SRAKPLKARSLSPSHFSAYSDASGRYATVGSSLSSRYGRLTSIIFRMPSPGFENRCKCTRQNFRSTANGVGVFQPANQSGIHFIGGCQFHFLMKAAGRYLFTFFNALIFDRRGGFDIEDQGVLASDYASKCRLIYQM